MWEVALMKGLRVRCLRDEAKDYQTNPQTPR